MKLYVRRISALMLTFLLLLSSMTVSAQTYHNIASSGETMITMAKVDGADRVDKNGNTIGQSGMNGWTFISFQADSKVTFRINIQKRGAYELFLGVAIANETYKDYAVSIDGGEETIVSAKPKNQNYDPNWNSVMMPVLEMGNHTITVRNVNASVHFMGIKLGFLATDMIIEDAKANDKSLLETVDISKGTDSFKVYFSELLDENTVNAETVSLTYDENGEKKNVLCDIVAEDKVLTVALRETLKEGAFYQLALDGIKDKYGVTEILGKTFNFIADSSEVSNGTIEAAAELDYGDAKIRGKYISSEGLGISGRNIRFYLDSLGDAPLKTAATDENGEFEIDFVFPEDLESDTYTFILDGDYVISPCEFDVMYITLEKEKELLNSLAGMTEASEIEGFLTQYEGLLGLDLDADLTNISNPDPVYLGLRKAFSDASALRTEFYTYVALETINQTEDADILAQVLESEENCALLDLSSERIALVKENKASMLADILALDAKADKDALKEAVMPIVEKWAAVEYGFSDLEIAETDKEVYQGKGIELSLGFTEKAEGLKKAEFIVEVQDEDMLSYMTYEAEENVSSLLSENANEIPVSSEVNANELKEKLGTLYLTAPEKAGTYTVKISGKAEFEGENGLIFITQITEKIISITVNQTPKKETGSKTSSQGSRGGSASSGMTVSDYKEEIEKQEQQIEQEKYKFSDLQSADWAEEYIYTLVEKSVISKSEDNMFYPLRNITRAEFTKMLVTGLGLSDESAKSSFVDVDENAWYYTYVAAAQKHGLINGNENNEFCANDNITRQDMAVIISRVLEKLDFKSSADEESFKDDGDISPYAKASVYTMKNLGIINGVGDNMFAPKDNANRAMAAKIICETMKAAKLA